MLDFPLSNFLNFGLPNLSNVTPNSGSEAKSIPESRIGVIPRHAISLAETGIVMLRA